MCYSEKSAQRYLTQAIVTSKCGYTVAAGPRLQVAKLFASHPDHLLHCDGDPYEVGRQDQGQEDQQPGHVRRQPPPEQHGGGGGDGDAAAPGRNRCAPSLHHLCIMDHVCTLVCTRFDKILLWKI